MSPRSSIVGVVGIVAIIAIVVALLGAGAAILFVGRPAPPNAPPLLDSSAVARLLAAHDAKASAIEAKIATVEGELQALLTGLRSAEREERDLAGHVVDLENEIAREERIAGLPLPNVSGLRSEIERGLARLETLLREIAAGHARADEFVRSREALRRESVAPLAAAAEVLWQRDRALAAEAGGGGAAGPRSAQSVSELATRYYELGKRKPDERVYWERARTLYEEFLALPDVAAAKGDDAR